MCLDRRSGVTHLFKVALSASSFQPGRCCSGLLWCCSVCVLQMWTNVLFQHFHRSPVLSCVSSRPSFFPLRLYKTVLGPFQHNWGLSACPPPPPQQAWATWSGWWFSVRPGWFSSSRAGRRDPGLWWWWAGRPQWLLQGYNSSTHKW